MSERRKSWFREHARERVRRALSQELGDLDEIPRSYWMTRVYVEDVLAVLSPGAIPDDPDDLKPCYTDGWADGGCDFICRHEGTVTIVQAKYRNEKAHEKPDALDNFANILTRIHPQHGVRIPKNSGVREIIADIDWSNDSFDLHFITLGKINDEMRARELQGAVAPKDFEDVLDRTDLTLLNEADLNERLRDAESASYGVQEPISIPFSPAAEGQPPWLSLVGDDSRRAWIGLVSAKSLANMKRYRNRLFSLNIRNYIGDKGTNAQIKKSAKMEPDNFFFYNNGVSAVATKVQPDEASGTLLCEQFSVINGAQTVRSLMKAHQEQARDVGRARVLLRVTEIAIRNKASDQAFVESITQYNNTQNAVRISDFRSNDPVQRALNKRFAQVSRKGGKTYLYKNKRCADRDKNIIAIAMEEFAQTIYSFRYGPADARGGRKYLFDTSAEGGYVKLFGTDGEVWPGLTDDQFARLAGEWLLCAEAREAMAAIKEGALARAADDQKTIVKAALERRWMLFYTLRCLLDERYGREERSLEADIARLANPKWLDEDESTGTRAAVRQYCNAAREVLVRVYRGASKLPSFVQRNWYRSEETLRELRDDIRNAETMVDALPLLKDAR